MDVSRKYAILCALITYMYYMYFYGQNWLLKEGVNSIIHVWNALPWQQLHQYYQISYIIYMYNNSVCILYYSAVLLKEILYL